MAAIHKEVFENVAQMHKADDIALHGFLAQLMAGQYDVYRTSPDLRVQVETLSLTIVCKWQLHTFCVHGMCIVSMLTCPWLCR